jgi:predicted phosphodiesterase
VLNDLFSEPTIVTSDLHNHAEAVFERIKNETNINIKDFHIITAGDMAGQGYFGSDGNPTKVYKYLSKNSKSLLVVQGNHDLPPDPVEDKNFDDKVILGNGTPKVSLYVTIN